MTAPAPVRVREASGEELAGWDARLADLPNARVVHTRAWVESLGDCGFGTPLYLVFEADGGVVGCLPGLLRRVGPWCLFGSPLAGWQTISLGPAFDGGRVATADLMGPLVTHLERRHGVAHIELMHPALEPEAMRALGFTGEPVATYRAALHPGDEARTFRAMKDSARRNVRRAERLGLVVRFAEHDEGFVDEHYDQAVAVYRRRGAAIPFSRDRVRQCFRRMRDAGCLLAPCVYLPDGRTCIASGMFLMGYGELLLWSWAHRDRYRWYRGTELMTWTVMRRAMAAGCASFDLMGRGDFKAKLGAELEYRKWRWMRSRPRWLALARRVAEAGYRSQQALRGRVGRLAARVATADPGRAPAGVGHE
ncbi:MAG TPA: GNAT family N-acetyltransferase [Gemmatimonadales bacterium]|nr:GNAT family N-acetyltransferase [Gemmatimonadales bacterium]